MTVLAACGPLPRPFQPEQKRLGDNPLLILPDGRGIAVAPVTGDVPDDGGVFAKAMARALQDANIPATVGTGGRNTRWLLGHAEREGAAADGGNAVERLRLVWELYDAGGGRLGTHEQFIAFPAGEWPEGYAATAESAANEAASSIAAFVQKPDVVETELPGYPPGTRIHVEPPAAGDGEHARVLAASMRRRLEGAGLPLTDDPQPGDVIVAHELSFGPERGGVTDVSLVWRVRREGDADDFGDLRQDNAVPTAQIEAEWQALSRLIVEAAAADLRRVIAAGAPSQ